MSYLKAVIIKKRCFSLLSSLSEKQNLFRGSYSSNANFTEWEIMFYSGGIAWKHTLVQEVFFLLSKLSLSLQTTEKKRSLDASRLAYASSRLFDEIKERKPVRPGYEDATLRNRGQVPAKFASIWIQVKQYKNFFTRINTKLFCSV